MQVSATERKFAHGMQVAHSTLVEGLFKNVPFDTGHPPWKFVGILRVQDQPMVAMFSSNKSPFCHELVLS